jgi:RNA polymerase sigma-70 factor (ECF subfamily)
VQEPEQDDARDRALLAAHVGGDGDAFATLVRAHTGRLWAVALRTTGDREEAADALQDALLSASRAAGSYRGDARVTTWLHRVVVNACLDRARRRAARPTVPMPEGYDAPAPVTRTPTARRPWSSRPRWPRCPAEQRAAIVLVDVHGWPVEEAARILPCRRGR